MMIVPRLVLHGGLRPPDRASARTRWAPIRPTGRVICLRHENFAEKSLARKN
jgi:hypothetical protein